MNSEIIKKLADLRVLFVDDEKAVSDSMSRFLSRIFKEVATASNGEDGIAKFNEFMPDIVISDITMPRLNGIEMSKRIRSEHPSTKIIFTTGHSEAVEELVDSNTACIIKPIDSDELISVLGKFFNF